MFKRILIPFIICLLALGGMELNNRVEDLQQQLHQTDYHAAHGLRLVIDRVLPSVVCIDANSNEYGGWSGSGVIVGPNSVLTARHVIEDANDFTITDVNGDEHKAVKWIVDPNNDCGLLFFEEKLGPVVEFADSGKLSLGDSIFMIGSPYGYDFFNTVTAGIVSGLERDISYFGETPTLTVDAASNPGNSGGPVFDMRGRIVGILVGSIWGADDLSILISADTCKKLLE